MHNYNDYDLHHGSSCNNYRNYIYLYISYLLDNYTHLLELVCNQNKHCFCWVKFLVHAEVMLFSNYIFGRLFKFSKIILKSGSDERVKFTLCGGLVIMTFKNVLHIFANHVNSKFYLNFPSCKFIGLYTALEELCKS